MVPNKKINSRVILPKKKMQYYDAKVLNNQYSNTIMFVRFKLIFP